MTDIKSPSAAVVVASRHLPRVTQAEAAALIHVSTRSWVHYEAGTRTMPAASWELFLLKTNQHPTMRLAKKR